jgi:NADPH:quinone reductase-like Zn-dependent oxidoreductase
VQAITYHRYGPPEVLELETVDLPALGDDEVLVRVRAASVNPRDWHYLRGLPYIMRPIGLRIPGDGGLGSDMAGQVEAVGRAVTRFRPGDEVYAFVLAGGFAEYARVPENVLGPKPANLSFEQAAAVPLAALTALQGLRDHGRVQPGQRVLIIGASGGVGTFAVQLAKLFGAEVTGVCSTRNLELVRSLGADHVIDYTREDFAGNGRRYDLVFQLAGTRSPAAIRRALTPRGRLILSSGESSGRWVGPMDRIVKAAALSPFVPQTLAPFEAKQSRDDLQVLKDLIEAGKLTPVIDRTYPLRETPEALRYLEKGHARGKVVITVRD